MSTIEELRALGALALLWLAIRLLPDRFDHTKKALADVGRNLAL